jgi:hypothetical protein
MGCAFQGFNTQVARGPLGLKKTAALRFVRRRSGAVVAMH